MFEVLIREAAARFGLGDKALPLIQMLLAYMTDKETGGLVGFLEKFKAGGLGPIIQSWLGGGPAAQPVSNSQLENVLGSSGGLLSMATSQLAVPRDNITSALGYLLPVIIGKLTPGGSLPSGLPPEITSLASVGQGLLSAVPAEEGPRAGAGGIGKWLPWIIVVLAVLLGLSYFAKSRTADTPAEPEPAASAPAAAIEPASEAASPAAVAEPASAAQPASASEPASAAEPAPAVQPASEASAP